MIDARHTRTLVVTGVIASLLTMAFHPTGQSVLANAQAGGQNAIARGTHILAIAALPLLLAGMGALSWRLRHRPALAGVGFLAYVLAAFAILIAAVMSGLVAPRLAEIFVDVSAADRPGVMQQWYLSHNYNQAFAQISVMLTGLALLSWSWAMRGVVAFPVGLQRLGLALGLIGTIGAVFNLLPLDVHRYGLIVLAQSSWMLWSAQAMAREVAT